MKRNTWSVERDRTKRADSLHPVSETKRYAEPPTCVAADARPCDVGPMCWTAELDRRLRTLVASDTAADVIAAKLDTTVQEIERRLREIALDA